MSLKIGLVIYGSLDTLSGGYLYDRMLVRELEAAGAQIEVLALPWRTYAAHLCDNLNQTFLRRILDGNYDLLLQDELNHPSLFWLNRRLRAPSRLPIVSIVHHLRSHEEHPRPLMPLYRAIETSYLRSVDAFLVNSWTTRRAVLHALNIHPTSDDIPHSPVQPPIHVAYPAGDHLPAPPAHTVTQRIESDYAIAQSREPYAQKTLQIAFVGNIMPRKKLHIVLAAMDLVQHSRPDLQLHLHVMGNLQSDSAYTQHIRDLLTRFRLGGVVTLHGRVSDARLGELLAQCQVFALPSFEGFGIVYLEAMRHGLCPIASTAGAAHEVVQHGANGFLVAPDIAAGLAHRLMSLADHPATLRRVRLTAHTHALEHCTWQSTFSAVHQWLCEILNFKRVSYA